MRRFTSLAVAFVVSVFGGPIAGAQTHDRDARVEFGDRCQHAAGCDQLAAVSNCQAYASTAIDQNNRKARSGCVLSGPEWHSNRNNHETWCRGVGLARAEDEIQKRERVLRQCAAKGGEAAKCRAYAQSAVDQYNENVRRKCGFNDKRWSRNYGNHYNWCLNVSQGQRDGETRARAAALSGSCRKGF